MYILLFLVTIAESRLNDDEKNEFCINLNCNNNINKPVCGIREENDGVRFHKFKNECELLKYGCGVDEDNAYGLINMEYCDEAFSSEPKYNNSDENKSIGNCVELKCNETKEVCGIRPDGKGFRVKIFESECHMLKDNCQSNINYSITDLNICKGETFHDGQPNNIFIVDSSMLNFNATRNINESIDDFFAATHLVDMPVQELKGEELKEVNRRIFVKRLGPVKIFQPWITIPKVKKNDTWHEPLLSTCFHKCPRKCPDTYSPICGRPGIRAREPVLVFQNHCFMDFAQCKMRWENKSPTAISSTYQAVSFVFCLGDVMNNMYRFMPLVRTLQHMGRIKKKGVFHYKITSMRNYNNYLGLNPKFMG